MNNYRISDQGYHLIAGFEGVKLRPYQDSIGKWTVGIGFVTYKGQPVTSNTVLTPEEVQEEFKVQVMHYENEVNRLVTSNLKQQMFDALLSFTYNLGPRALEESTLLKKVNTTPIDVTISNEFVKWSTAGGKVIPGLFHRRQMEAKYYFS